MGAVSIEKMDRLYWLGRYTERTYTTIKEFFDGFDVMIEHPNYYETYCKHMEIPNVYTSAEDFIDGYLFDQNNINSVLGTLNAAYDNAIMVRDALGTECISYIELALTELETAKSKPSFLLNLQRVIDYLLAFIACFDENVEERNIRGIFKTGRRQERMDLVLRLHRDKDELVKAFHMLTARVLRADLPVRRDIYDELSVVMSEDRVHYQEAIQLLEQLFVV